MAHKSMTLTERGAQVYRTRALQAGDPVTLSGSDARLFAKHGWAEERTRKARKVAEPVEIAPIPTVEEVLSAEVVEEPAAEPPKPKKPAAKRKAKARK